VTPSEEKTNDGETFIYANKLVRILYVMYNLLLRNLLGPYFIILLHHLYYCFTLLFQEAKNAFKALLESVNVRSDWTWEQVDGAFSFSIHCVSNANYYYLNCNSGNERNHQ
jgi:hypothetical protein